MPRGKGEGKLVGWVVAQRLEEENKTRRCGCGRRYIVGGGRGRPQARGHRRFDAGAPKNGVERGRVREASSNVLL